MSEPLILAIDQGTTNTKAILVDGQGQVVARATRALRARFPQPAWVELDADEVRRSLDDVIDECLRAARGPRLAAVAVSNQRESVLLWERASGRPLGPVVTWQCRRTAAACAELRARGAADFIAERTGLQLDPLFSASKLAWLLERLPEGPARIARGEIAAGTIDSFVVAHLTSGGHHVTDASNASRTQLLRLDRVDWDEELLALFAVPREVLPRIVPSSAVIGETRRRGELPAGVPIAALIADSHAALFAQGGFAPGAVKATYGTGTSLITPTASRPQSRHGLSATVAWQVGDVTTYALEGNISVTGSAIEWLGDLLGLRTADGEVAVRVAELAASVPDSGGVTLVPAFVGLGAPHWDESARGLVTGLTRGSTAAHLARATVESIAYQIMDVFSAMEKDGGQRFGTLFADGGASRNDQLMQLQADLLDREVLRSQNPELSATGAAHLAGLAVGIWRSQGELAGLPRLRDTFAPQMAGAARDRLVAAWRQALTRTRAHGEPA